MVIHPSSGEGSTPFTCAKYFFPQTGSSGGVRWAEAPTRAAQRRAGSAGFGALEAAVHGPEVLLDRAQGGDAIGPGLFAARPEGEHGVLDAVDGGLDRGRGGGQRLGALAPGLGGRVIAFPAAARALVT